jgi:Asp/Glu/hydantoin racemase
MKRIGIIHTSFVSVEHLKGLFAEILPGAQLTNIVDDSLLREVMANGGITPAIVKRMCSYVQMLEVSGVDAIFNQCSSVGEAFDIAIRQTNLPVLKVDRPMAEKAVSLGKRIAVVATVASTLEPSCNLAKAAARDAGKEVEVVPALVDGALDILMKENNRARHNELVKAKIESIQEQVDVIVLAQGSMVVLLPELEHIQKPVLSSPQLGVERMCAMLD